MLVQINCKKCGYPLHKNNTKQLCNLCTQGRIRWTQKDKQIVQRIKQLQHEKRLLTKDLLAKYPYYSVRSVIRNTKLDRKGVCKVGEMLIT